MYVPLNPTFKASTTATSFKSTTAISVAGAAAEADAVAGRGAVSLACQLAHLW